MDNLDVLLQRAGLKVTDADREKLRLFFEKYKERLEVLTSADLAEEEVAGVFLPQ